MPAMVQDDSKHRLIQPNAQHQYNVTAADLPLSCPMPGMFLWNSHPKVYLAIEPTGWAKCPYCSAEYKLVRRFAPTSNGVEAIPNDMSSEESV